MFVDKCTVEHVPHQNDDLLIVNSARASFDRHSTYRTKRKLDDDFEISKDCFLKKGDAGLINHLWTHEHIGCFFHNTLAFVREASPLQAFERSCATELGQFRRIPVRLKENGNVEYIERGSLLGYAIDKDRNTVITKNIMDRVPFTSKMFMSEEEMQEDLDTTDVIETDDLTSMLWSEDGFYSAMDTMELKIKDQTPFKFPLITLRLTTPIFVARQYWRHCMGFARNEVSRRYMDGDKKPVEHFLPQEWRAKPADGVKQGSDWENSIDLKPLAYGAEGYLTYEKVLKIATDYFNYMNQMEVATEQSRMVLPQSMMTTWVETASLLDYARIAHLRLKKNAQKEIYDLAQLVIGMVEQQYPKAWKQLMSMYRYAN